MLPTLSADSYNGRRDNYYDYLISIIACKSPCVEIFWEELCCTRKCKAIAVPKIFKIMMTIAVTMTVMMLIKGLIQAHGWVALQDQEEAAMVP